MSTRSRICIRLNDSDLDKGLAQDRSQVPFKIDRPSVKPEPQPHVCTFPSDAGRYISAYCHFDGYPDGVGSTLMAAVKDYDTALNLILGGDMSYLQSDAVLYYADRDEDWDAIAPKQTDGPYENNLFIEYVYTLEDGVWYVTPARCTEKSDEYGVPMYTSGERCELAKVLDEHLIDDSTGHWVPIEETKD